MFLGCQVRTHAAFLDSKATLARYVLIIRVVVKPKVFLAMCVDIGDTGPPDLPLIGLSPTSVTMSMMSMISDILVYLTTSA